MAEANVLYNFCSTTEGQLMNGNLLGFRILLIFILHSHRCIKPGQNRLKLCFWIYLFAICFVLLLNNLIAQKIDALSGSWTK